MPLGKIREDEGIPCEAVFDMLYLEAGYNGVYLGSGKEEPSPLMGLGGGSVKGGEKPLGSWRIF
jgi:hypothetical protein